MPVIPRHATWVRFPRYVGDAIMQFSVLRLLRPVVGTPLVVWGPRLTVSLVEGTDLADAVLPDDGKPNAWALRKILVAHRAARSVHFPKSLRPALAAFLARIPERIGVSESLAGLFNTHTAPFWNAEGSCIERYRRILLQRWPQLPEAPFPDYQSPAQVEVLKEPYICLMPGASTTSNTWEATHFARLAELIAKQGYRPVVLGSTAEKALGEAVAGTQGLNLCGDTLVQAAAWLRTAAGAVGKVRRDIARVRTVLAEKAKQV